MASNKKNLFVQKEDVTVSLFVFDVTIKAEKKIKKDHIEKKFTCAS